MFMIKEGLFYDLPSKDYYNISVTEAVSFSSVSVFASEASPKHYFQKTLSSQAPERPFSPALYHGSLFHSLCELGEASFFQKHVIIPSEVRKGCGEYLRILAENPGKKPVRQQDFAPVHAMYKSLSKTKNFQSIMSQAKHEVSMFWKYRGHWVKGRMDIVLPGLILDFKTTKNANPFTQDGFQKSISDYKYNAQAAFYTWGYEVITGVRPRFAIAAVEKEYPHECAFFEITEKQIKEGMEIIKPHLDKMISCLKTGNWGDGYGEIFHTPDSIGKNPLLNINFFTRNIA